MFNRNYDATIIKFLCYDIQIVYVEVYTFHNMHNEVRVFNPNFHLDISLVFDYFSDALGPFVYNKYFEIFN